MISGLPFHPNLLTTAFEQRFDALTPGASKLLKGCAGLKDFLPRAVSFLSGDNALSSEQVAHYLMGKVDYLPVGLAMPTSEIPPDVKNALYDLLRTHRHNNGITGFLFGKTETPEKTIVKLEALSAHLDASMGKPASIDDVGPWNLRNLGRQLTDVMPDDSLNKVKAAVENFSFGNDINGYIDKNYNIIRFYVGKYPAVEVVNIHLSADGNIVTSIGNPIDPPNAALLSKLSEVGAIQPLLLEKVRVSQIENKEPAGRFLESQNNQLRPVYDNIGVKRTENWLEKKQYVNSNFFSYNPSIYHKENNSLATVKDLLNFLKSQASAGYKHNIQSGDVPADFKPTGRIGDGLKRDEGFYRNTRKALETLDLKDSLVINYTGHEGPVAAALSEVGVPTVWQLTLCERITNQLQDWCDKMKFNPNAEENCVGIILEPNHGFTQVDVSGLPTEEQLRDEKKNNIIVFSENKYGATYSLKDIPPNDPEFYLYLLQLEIKGLKVYVIGVDPD